MQLYYYYCCCCYTEEASIRKKYYIEKEGYNFFANNILFLKIAIPFFISCSPEYKNKFLLGWWTYFQAISLQTLKRYCFSWIWLALPFKIISQYSPFCKTLFFLSKILQSFICVTRYWPHQLFPLTRFHSLPSSAMNCLMHLDFPSECLLFVPVV